MQRFRLLQRLYRVVAFNQQIPICGAVGVLQLKSFSSNQAGTDAPIQSAGTQEYQRAFQERHAAKEASATAAAGADEDNDDDGAVQRPGAQTSQQEGQSQSGGKAMVQAGEMLKRVQEYLIAYKSRFNAEPKPKALKPGNFYRFVDTQYVMTELCDKFIAGIGREMAEKLLAERPDLLLHDAAELKSRVPTVAAILGLTEADILKIACKDAHILVRTPEHLQEWLKKITEVLGIDKDMVTHMLLLEPFFISKSPSHIQKRLDVFKPLAPLISFDVRLVLFHRPELLYRGIDTFARKVNLLVEAMSQSDVKLNELQAATPSTISKVLCRSDDKIVNWRLRVDQQ